MITFDHPELLLLLLLLVPAVFLSHFWRGRGGRLVLAFSRWPRRPQVLRSWTAAFTGSLHSFLFWLSLGLLVTILAGPVWVSRERIHLEPGQDIMLILDESPSMAAQDFLPNRFASAQSVMEGFIRGRENDSIGLVTFGREAALRVPLTRDYTFLMDQLAEQQIMRLGDGTAMGMALALGALHLQNSSSQNRIMILLTDGENNSGEIEPATAASVARSLGIRIYAIGIGSRQRVPIQFRNPETGTLYDGTIEEAFDEVLLRSLVHDPEGYYFSAADPGSLEGIFRSIDSRESQESRTQIRVKRQPLYRQMILLVLILLTLLILSSRLFFREVL